MNQVTPTGKKSAVTVKCDICHREFNLTKNSVEEKSVLLEKEGLEPKPVTLTIVTCACCGKCYPVLLDDDETLALVESLKKLVLKEHKAQAKGITTPVKQLRKQRTLKCKLTFKRQQLAEKFNGSFYQTEDGKEQLEYHYHV